MVPHTRRSFLTVLPIGLTGIAGCAGGGQPQDGGDGSDGSAGTRGPAATAVMTMTRVNDTDIARRFAVEFSSETDNTRQVFERIVENGSATVEAVEPPISSSDRVGPWMYENTIYRVSYEVTGQRSAAEYTLKIDPVEGSVSDDEVISFEELPAVDREKLASIGFETVGEDEILGLGTTLTYANAERETSALVPTPDRSVIVWESGRRARITVDGHHTTSTKTYNYTVERIGPAEEYGQKHRERHAFELSNHSGTEREIIQQAIDSDGKYAPISEEEEPEATPTPALRTLMVRFRTHDRVVFPTDDDLPPKPDGTYLVRYDGELYWTELGVDQDEFDANANTEQRNETTS